MRDRGQSAVAATRRLLVRVRDDNCIVACVYGSCTARQMRHGLFLANILAWAAIVAAFGWLA